MIANDSEGDFLPAMGWGGVLEGSIHLEFQDMSNHNWLDNNWRRFNCVSSVGADSDDSESEGGLGNVSRVVMRPPGHSGKAKKGHLCFDAAFETGQSGALKSLRVATPSFTSQ